MRGWQPRPLEVAPNLVERTHQALLDAICGGRLGSGERLTQEGLAELLGVSRQPISHALVLLKQQGFVREAPGRGLEVAPVDPDHLKAIFEVRAALDDLAAGAAARRGCQDHGAARLLARLDDVLRAGQEAVDRADLPALVRRDVDFHALLAELSGNPVVLEINQRQWAHIRRGIAVALEDPAFHQRCWTEHAAIAAAVRSGQAESAAHLARTHCEVAGAETWRRLIDRANNRAA